VPAPAPVAKAPPAVASKAAAQEHTVQIGDSLSRVAQKYYGDITKWSKIYEANKQTIKNPNYIFVGQKIVIPGADASGT
jgi:nucleoid-associated protein YgaU